MLLAAHLLKRSQQISKQLPHTFFWLFDGFIVQQIYQITLLLLLNFIVVKILLFKYRLRIPYICLIQAKNLHGSDVCSC